MPIWNHEADVMLLTAIVKAHKIKVDMKLICDELKSSGSKNMENVTVSSLENRMRKIKTGAALKGVTTPKNNDGDASPVTPDNATKKVAAPADGSPKPRPGANKKGIARPVKKKPAKPSSETESEEGEVSDGNKAQRVVKKSTPNRSREMTEEAPSKKVKVEEADDDAV